MTIYQAPKTIPRNKKLLMVDFLETIVDCTAELKKENEKFVPRKGIEDFLKYYKQEGKIIVIVSDSSRENITKHLNGLGKYFDKIYANETTEVINKKVYKNLKLPCEEYNIPKEQAILIGDGTSDYYSALKYDTDVILVPWPEQNPNFSFVQLLPNKNIQNYLGLLEVQKNLGADFFLAEAREQIKINSVINEREQLIEKTNTKRKLYELLETTNSREKFGKCLDKAS